MPSPFESAGATKDPSRSAPLHTNRFFTGLWTQRSPLRDAATPFVYEKFYSATRFDSLIGGANTEITTRLTLARRPGHSVYNTSSLQYQRIVPFRTFVNAQEQIHVMADCASAGTAQLYGSARDVTGPSGNTLLVAKLANSRTFFFQSVGNILFMCDEAQCLKWVLSGVSWNPHTTIAAGAFVLDSNNNLQLTVKGGVTGSGPVAWPAAIGSTIHDGSVVWLCKGSPVMNWGIAAPLSSAYVGQTSYYVTGQNWTPGTVYLLGLIANDHVTNTAQMLIAAGITAPNAPSFSTVPGQATVDGGATWQCVGSTAWAPNQGHAVGDVVYINNLSGNQLGGSGNFQCVVPGSTGAAQPQWAAGAGSVVMDGTVMWTALGPYTDISNANPSGSTDTYLRNAAVSLLTSVLDNKGGKQQLVLGGPSGAQAPNWSETLGQLTSDGYAAWTCIALAPNTTSPWTYAYAFRNSLTGHISTASPVSKQIVPSVGNVVVLTGTGSSDPQVDTIRLYRTVQGGGPLLFLADIAAPAPGASWSYYDNAPDSALNPLIQAQIALTNNPPPTTIAAPNFYLGRIWAFDGNVLRYSGGPDTLSGSGFEAWPPLNAYTLPARGVRLWPTAIGLIVFTLSDVYIVLGQGTLAAPFYITIFQEGVGLLNYDSFAVNGSTGYMLTSALRCISFDPGAGETEVGFPIGDLLSSYTPSGAHMAYHEGSSADTALYVADGTAGWYRMSTINAPESGQVWSPQALPMGGVTTIGSVEVSPGVKKLLVASYGAGPLLMRDASRNTDNGRLFQPTAIIGSIVLAQPGQIAAVQFLTLDTIATGTRATLGLLFGEISGTFTYLQPTRQDPTLLPPSSTLRGDRYYMDQAGRPAWCRHMQIEVVWPAEDAANELLAYTLFGEIKQERPEN